MTIAGSSRRMIGSWPIASALMNPADGRSALRLIAWSRVGLGVVALLAPGLPAGFWLGRVAGKSQAGRVLGRALGARDLVLGVGATRALKSMDGSEAAWAKAGIVADSLDTAITLMSFRSLPRGGRLGVLAAAGGAAVLGAAAARSL